MRTLVIGVDSGTQSTKVLVVNTRDGSVVGESSRAYGLIPNLPPGAKEQHPRTWREAAGQAIKDALKHAKATAAEVAAIGVSGQQHGFVPLDETGRVIRPAKLWNDTSTAAECAEIMDACGGPEEFQRKTGNRLPPGFTAGNILWLKRHEPENFARLATVLLPHDYLSFTLTGRLGMEYGDASGTALMDVRTRTWARDVLDFIDPALAEKMPPLGSSRKPAGILLPNLAKAGTCPSTSSSARAAATT